VLGVLAVAAHVPFAGCAGRTRRRVGTTDDADDQVAGLDRRVGRRLADPADVLVAQHQQLVTRGSLTIGAGHDLDVGPTQPDRQTLDQHRALARVGLGEGGQRQ
jgi:hypothetical protein